MEQPYDDNTLIIAYLEGDLSPEVENSFLLRLEQDPVLKAELEAYQSLYSGLDGLKREARTRVEVMAALDSMSEEQSEVEPNVETTTLTLNSSRRFLWWGLAASILLLCVITYLISPRTNPIYYQNEYPGTFAGGALLRGTNTHDAFQFAHALKIYDNVPLQDSLTYFDARQVFDSIKPENAWYEEAQIYRASCYLLENQASDAAIILTPLTEDLEVKEYALWFLALAYLHQGKSDLATPYLEEMVAEPGDFMDEEAARILAQLRWGF